MGIALNRIAKDVMRCYRCGDCREMWRYLTGTYGSCPVREELRHEHYCGRGRTAIARAILENKLSYNESLMDVVYTDLCCWNCHETCSLLEGYKIRVSLITRAMREDLVKLGIGPPKPLKKIGVNVKKKHNRFGLPKAGRKAWADGIDISRKAETLFFVGCHASYIYPEIAKATASILKEGGIEFTILDDEGCCGVTQIWDGQVQIAKTLANHNVKAIKEVCAKRVVTACAECYYTMKFDYPELTGDKLDFEVLHVSELVSDLNEKDKIKFKECNKKITYHDPCQLGRGARIYEPPRNLLTRISGIELLEMKRNRGGSWCCGSGAGQVVRVAFPKLAMKIAADRLIEAKETKAEALVTACPFCLNLFAAAKKASGVRLELYDLTTFVMQAIETSN